MLLIIPLFIFLLLLKKILNFLSEKLFIIILLRCIFMGEVFVRLRDLVNIRRRRLVALEKKRRLAFLIWIKELRNFGEGKELQFRISDINFSMFNIGGIVWERGIWCVLLRLQVSGSFHFWYGQRVSFHLRGNWVVLVLSFRKCSRVVVGITEERRVGHFLYGLFMSCW